MSMSSDPFLGVDGCAFRGIATTTLARVSLQASCFCLGFRAACAAHDVLRAVLCIAKGL